MRPLTTPLYQVRASLLNLTTKDTAVLESSLGIILRLLPPESAPDRDLTVFHDEALLPRVIHVLIALSTGGFKPTPTIISQCTQIILSVIRNDGTATGTLCIPATPPFDVCLLRVPGLQSRGSCTPRAKSLPSVCLPI